MLSNRAQADHSLFPKPLAVLAYSSKRGIRVLALPKAAKTASHLPTRGEARIPAGLLFPARRATYRVRGARARQEGRQL